MTSVLSGAIPAQSGVDDPAAGALSGVAVAAADTTGDEARHRGVQFEKALGVAHAPTRLSPHRLQCWTKYEPRTMKVRSPQACMPQTQRRGFSCA